MNDSPRENRSDQSVANQLKTNISTLEEKLKNVSIGLIVVLIIAAGLSAYFLFLLPMHTNPQYQVVRVIDGDTFEIKYKGKLTSVQLFGVNAPETDKHPSKPPEPYGEEASVYLQDLLLDDSIYIRFDEHKFDQYERVWGYVYRASDGVFVNLEVIREGYAEVDLRYPFKYKELFRDYESRAKKERIGLWEVGLR